MKGNSFANGQSSFNGPGSPYWQAELQGWVIRPAAIWDYLQPRDYR